MSLDEVFSEVLDLHITEEPIRARDIQDGDVIRPAGWSGYHASLGIEPLASDFVRVLWRCDLGDQPPSAFTMFVGDEWVARR